jgi:hypothetical protein
MLAAVVAAIPTSAWLPAFAAEDNPSSGTMCAHNSPVTPPTTDGANEALVLSLEEHLESRQILAIGSAHGEGHKRRK